MTAMTRDQAAAAVAAAAAERDGIQANLMDLDGSFGKRLLEGAASLTGVTGKRWEEARGSLAALWQIFLAYSAAVDRAAELLARSRRPAGPELTEITGLLSGPSVRLSRAPAPLARRDLTDTGQTELTLAAAVQEMQRIYAGVADVVTAAETVWNELAGPLENAGAELAEARRQAGGLTDADDAVGGALAAAEAEKNALREVLNSDPLALWRGGRTDADRLDRLRDQAASVAAQVAELARLRDDAERRIAAATTAVSAVTAAWQDASRARERAAAKIAESALPPPPEAPALTARLAVVAELKAAGRWTRLAAELDDIGKQASAAAQLYRDAERMAAGALARRDELRGLLGAYQAKAATLGAAEDPELSARFDRARNLLWTAPCDLPAAAEAVRSYQQAILGLSGRGPR
ncbi:MAG TPA: hypothetical protein VE733_11930 [Streptosporangiaceae bacterium]|nr:hypothetical protein [Streptosporangiaceae bacterium]